MDPDCLYLHSPIAEVMLAIDTTKPTLVAMVVTKIAAERSDFGQISRKSIITGQLVFESSIALEREAAAKKAVAQEKALAGIELPPKKPRAPWEEAVYNAQNKRTALHRNLKDPSKLYVALDVISCYHTPLYFNDQGEVLTKDQVLPFLESTSSGGVTNDYSYQLHGTDKIGIFALCPAPETIEDKKEKLAKLITMLENAGAEVQ